MLANVLLLPPALALGPHTQSTKWEEKLIFTCFVMMEEKPFPNLLSEEPNSVRQNWKLEGYFLRELKCS